MPVNRCSDSGKPGFKWGEQGKCYIYTPGNTKSMNEAKRKAIIQGIATGEYNNVDKIDEQKIYALLDIINSLEAHNQGDEMNKNIEKMINDHKQMREWHESMAKSAAGMMEDHIKAANWHASQSDLIKGMTEVPLDPEKKQTTIPAAAYSPTPSSGGGMKVPEKEVPMDPDTVKKSDLISMLKQHESDHGSFDMNVEDIASFLLNG